VIIGGCDNTRAGCGAILILCFDAKFAARADEAILDRLNPFLDSGAVARLEG
jgi:hypothetical protein